MELGGTGGRDVSGRAGSSPGPAGRDPGDPRDAAPPVQPEDAGEDDAATVDRAQAHAQAMLGQAHSVERRDVEVALALEEARRPFELASSLPLRANLIRLAPDDYVLLLSIHHICSDGWSMGVLLHELSTLYEAFTLGQPSPLPELPIQYTNFATWQADWLSGERLDAQLTY